MMFVRNEAQPVTWNGTTFRSILERNVAEELQKMGIDYSYEPTIFHELSYLPDFRIYGVPDAEMDGVAWIEVKPAQAIYAVRDHFGMTERFTSPEAFRCTREDLANVAPELMKPKGLAELTGAAVLVASAVNRTSTVALVMFEEFVEVTRSHPIVNWRQVQQDRQREEQRRRWQIENERRRAEMLQRQAEIDERNRRAASQAVALFRTASRIPAKYDGTCRVCSQRRFAADLVVAQIPALQESGWVACCSSHLTVGA